MTSSLQESPRREMDLTTRNSTTPTLSIIIPTFNSAGSILQSLESVAAQTFTDYEVVVQDGSPNDDTARAIDRFLRSHPGYPLRLYRERDRGVYDAMNKAMVRASGNWLYFLGSDDQLFNDQVLATAMNAQNTRYCNVLYGNAEIIGDCAWGRSGMIYDGPFDLRMLLKRNICHQAIFYRADFVRRVGEYNPNYVICGDWDFNMRLWAQTRFKYITGGLSSSELRDAQFYKDFAANILRYFHLSPLNPLVNSPDFSGLPDVIVIQKSRGKLYSLCGRAVRRFLRMRTRLDAG
jgi:glycosyltransferase involved in cell wall biosynthesis